MTNEAEWILKAHNYLRDHYGIHSGLALNMATELHRREALMAGLLRQKIRGPVDAMFAHMEKKEAVE